MVEIENSKRAVFPVPLGLLFIVITLAIATELGSFVAVYLYIAFGTEMITSYFLPWLLYVVFAVLCLINLWKRRLARLAVFLIGIAAVYLCGLSRGIYGPALTDAIDHARLAANEGYYNELVVEARKQQPDVDQPVVLNWSYTVDGVANIFLVYDQSDRMMDNGKISQWARENVSRVPTDVRDTDCEADIGKLEGHFYRLRVFCSRSFP